MCSKKFKVWVLSLAKYITIVWVLALFSSFFSFCFCFFIFFKKKYTSLTLLEFSCTYIKSMDFIFAEMSWSGSFCWSTCPCACFSLCFVSDFPPPASSPVCLCVFHHASLWASSGQRSFPCWSQPHLSSIYFTSCRWSPSSVATT